MLTARSVMGRWSARKNPSACCSRLDWWNLTRWWLRKPKDRNAARNFCDEVPISYWSLYKQMNKASATLRRRVRGSRWWKPQRELGHIHYNRYTYLHDILVGNLCQLSLRRNMRAHLGPGLRRSRSQLFFR